MDQPVTGVEPTASTPSLPMDTYWSPDFKEPSSSTWKVDEEPTFNLEPSMPTDRRCHWVPVAPMMMPNSSEAAWTRAARVAAERMEKVVNCMCAVEEGKGGRVRDLYTVLRGAWNWLPHCVMLQVTRGVCVCGGASVLSSGLAGQKRLVCLRDWLHKCRTMAS